MFLVNFCIFFYIYNENIVAYLNKHSKYIVRKHYKTILINFLQQNYYEIYGLCIK